MSATERLALTRFAPSFSSQLCPGWQSRLIRRIPPAFVHNRLREGWPDTIPREAASQA